MALLVVGPVSRIRRIGSTGQSSRWCGRAFWVRSANQKQRRSIFQVSDSTDFSVNFEFSFRPEYISKLAFLYSNVEHSPFHQIRTNILTVN